ncbi:MAG: glycosyltransferase [Euryarchaeota archaeon]|nr:glycosyltransferase [Euryarchaeota archaeon]MDE1835746.1 glycosyltransferase [Euryarchaeota archaeon]MDE1880829.1 glycosyltransferase [Euryarchaeota archaeon]MDE2043937.1 glycosyltransferase [Thermoplasmata archaeon]
MRIAFFSETFLPVHDGVGHVLEDLGTSLVRRGNEVTLYTTRRPGQPREELWPGGMRVVRCRSFPLPHYPQYRFATFPYLLALAPGFARRTDIVHVHTPFAMGVTGLLASRRDHLPIVGTFHTDFRGMQGSFPQNLGIRVFFPLGGFFSEGIYFRCDTTTAPTPEALRTLRERFTKPPHCDLAVVPNGIDIVRFRPGLGSPDWSSRLRSEGRPLVTFLGRLTADKGVHRFLDALREIPEDLSFQGVVGGSGVEEPEVRRRIESERGLRGRVVAVGFVKDDEKPALLAQSRVFVLPSLADTSSVSTLEAMASGCACVVTDRGGPRELVMDGRNALLADPTDPTAIRGAVERLLRDPERARWLGSNAVEYVRAHASVEHMAEQYLEIYERCLGRGSSAQARPGTPVLTRGIP